MGVEQAGDRGGGGIMQSFGEEKARERGHLKYLDEDGKLLLKWIINKWESGMDWIGLAQGRDV